MAVKIRLNRTGAKKAPHYRLVVADSKAPRDGKFIEIIGHYIPTCDPSILEVDADKAVAWLMNGAQPSDTAKSLLTRAGVMEQFEAAKKTRSTK